MSGKQTKTNDSRIKHDMHYPVGKHVFPKRKLFALINQEL